MVTSFIGRLKSECAKRGGVLKSNDLDNLGKEFEKKTVALQNAFRLSFEETIRARERSILNNKRTDCFERMMVEIISRLLADDAEKPVHGEKISRRALPGFLLTLDKMLGDDVIDGFERKRAILSNGSPKIMGTISTGAAFINPRKRETSS